MEYKEICKILEYLNNHNKDFKDMREDKFKKMTEEIVIDLWNDKRLSREGLWNIVFEIIKKLLW